MSDDLLYFEDLEIGTKASFGRYEVTREEVLEFAAKYDPQPFHLSDEAAAKTHFGRISASGWHTCAMTMRMLVDNITERKQAGLGSPGQDELRWHRRRELKRPMPHRSRRHPTRSAWRGGRWPIPTSSPKPRTASSWSINTPRTSVWFSNGSRPLAHKAP